MTSHPPIERRIAAAMALAGLDFDGLADRIATKNYGARTLRRIADPDDIERVVRGPDLHIIGTACGVSDAFWTIDFAELADADLGDEVRRLSAAVAQLAGDVARQAQALQAHRDTDHPTGLSGDAGR